MEEEKAKTVPVELVAYKRKKGELYDIVIMTFRVPKSFDLRSDIDVIELFEATRFFKNLSDRVREELFNKYVRKR
jgi:hypothetical protein